MEQLHASEVDSHYARHGATCAQSESDPSSVRCAHGNLSGCIAEAAALCDANEWCAAVQYSATVPEDELRL